MYVMLVCMYIDMKKSDTGKIANCFLLKMNMSTDV